VTAMTAIRMRPPSCLNRLIGRIAHHHDALTLMEGYRGFAYPARSSAEDMAWAPNAWQNGAGKSRAVNTCRRRK
jgi:hypothetical protein